VSPEAAPHAALALLTEVAGTECEPLIPEGETTMRWLTFLARWGDRVRHWLCRLTESTPNAAELAEGRLRGKPYLAFTGVSCLFRDGVLTLHGRVNSAALRRIAAAVAGRVPGVEWVENTIEAEAPPRRRSAPALRRGQPSRPR
jgi:hypothetical protein